MELYRQQKPPRTSEFQVGKSTSCKTNIKWVTAIFVASDGFIVPFISDTLSCASFIGWLTDCCSRLASRQNDSWLTDLQRCATFTPLTPRPSGPSWFFTQLIDCWVVIVDKDTFYSCINSTCVKYNFQNLSGITFWFQEITFIFNLISLRTHIVITNSFMNNLIDSRKIYISKGKRMG